MSVENLSQLSLYTFGFFYTILSPTHDSSSSITHIASKTKIDIWNMLKLSNDKNLKRPVVVLDEFPTTSGVKDDCRLRFMRNCIRSLNFVLIIMGTNAAAANLLEQNLQSREVIHKYWCFLYPRLPRINTAMLNLPSKLQNKIVQIISSSRPLFGIFAADNLPGDSKYSSDFMDQWLTNIAQCISKSKNLFNNNFGRHGQLCLFLNMSYAYAKENHNSCNTPLINHHFAQLTDSECVELNSSLQTSTGEEWDPKCCFPSPSDDLLLYLCLMGTSKFHPFQIGSKKVSFCKAVKEINSLRQNRQLFFMNDNATQSCNDGMFMEATLAGILCASSRRDGVKGITLHRFISTMWSHLLLTNDQFEEYHLSKAELSPDFVCFLDTFVIPILAPPNQNWPSFLKNNPFINSGMLECPKNKSGVDIQTDFNLSGECKDYKSRISGRVMHNIISRIPLKTKVHIVFVRQLQKSYQHFSTYTQISFCVVKEENDELKLKNIKGLPPLNDFTSHHILVVFFEVDKFFMNITTNTGGGIVDEAVGGIKMRHYRTTYFCT
jgi:hypothetical protein